MFHVERFSLIEEPRRLLKFRGAMVFDSLLPLLPWPKAIFHLGGSWNRNNFEISSHLFVDWIRGFLGYFLGASDEQDAAGGKREGDGRAPRGAGEESGGLGGLGLADQEGEASSGSDEAGRSWDC